MGLCNGFTMPVPKARPPKADNVNKPAHYLKGGMECIDVIKAVTSDLSGADAYYVGNIIKYVWRYNHKNGVEDLRKAKHYLEWLIEEVGKNANKA